jgi:hypothetical protein
MKGFIFLLATLLLGLTGSASAKTNAVVTSMGDPRLAWAPEDGCKPGASHTFDCPVKMVCFPSKQFKKGGYCDCNSLFLNTPRKLEFDDSEWDDGFDTADCKTWNLAKFLIGLFHLMSFIWGVAFLHTLFLVIRELARQKALKMNATTYAMFYSFLGGTALTLVFLQYWLNTWDMEPEFFYNRRWIMFVFGVQLSNSTCDVEIGCTWIDLVDRTQKMSKSSSRGLLVLRWFLRIIGGGFALFLAYSTITGGIGGLLFSATLPAIFSGLLMTIAGILIVRTICPNLKDTSNPNWKVGKSIHRTTFYTVLGKCLELAGLYGMMNTALRPTLSYHYACFNGLYFWGYMFRLWAYLGYIITGNRKHLKSYESDEISGFFGLSTIGLNKTVTKASSVMSSRFTSSSAAPSTVEKD